MVAGNPYPNGVGYAVWVTLRQQSHVDRLLAGDTVAYHAAWLLGELQRVAIAQEKTVHVPPLTHVWIVGPDGRTVACLRKEE